MEQITRERDHTNLPLWKLPVIWEVSQEDCLGASRQGVLSITILVPLGAETHRADIFAVIGHHRPAKKMPIVWLQLGRPHNSHPPSNKRRENANLTSSTESSPPFSMPLQPCGSKVSSFTRYPSVLELYSKWSPYVIEERAPDLSFIISFGDRQDIVSVIDFLNERVRKTKRVFDFATQRETTFVDLFSFLLGLTVCVHLPDSCSVSCSMLQIIKRYVAKDHNGSHS